MIFQKSTKREPQTKSFVKRIKKIAEQKNARLLLYKVKSFCPLTFGLGYARIATTLTAKK